MSDVIDPHGSLKEEFERVATETVDPYYQDITESFQRAYRLGRHAATLVRAGNPNARAFRRVSDDIFRSVVVLTHAHLEDFLRTMGKAFLPQSDHRTLNDVLLVGSSDSGRAEKFYLGSLACHRGKLVDDVIRESVDEYLGRVSFNNTTDIMNFLKQIGLKVREKIREQLPAIEQ
jgi:hypothetical protein